MKVPAIKKAAEEHSYADLNQAKDDLLDAKELQIEIIGEDDGEQLTHIIAAMWVQEQMARREIDMRTALREYAVKVRESMS